MSHLSKKRKAESSEMEQELQSVDMRSTTHADGTTTQELLRFLIEANAHDPAFANMLQNEWAKAQVVGAFCLFVCLQTWTAFHS